MSNELEAITGRVVDTPKPPMPEGIAEFGPDSDTPDMTQAGGGERLLPGGVVLDYTDAAGNESRRTVTVLTVEREGSDPRVTALCHLRRANRVFRLSGITGVRDPLEAGAPYDSMAACLDRFRIPGGAGGAGDSRAATWDQIVILMFIARSDGNIHPSERSFVIKFVAEAQARLDISTLEAWAIIVRLYPDARVMRDSARALARANGPDAPRDFKETVQAMIRADGVVSADEALHKIELTDLDYKAS